MDKICRNYGKRKSPPPVLKLGHFECRSEIPGKFRNVVLEKDGEDQFDRSSETRGSIAWSQGKTEYSTYTIKRNANWTGHM
jgi:hypothetical protein